jgi:NAD(P)-dependent dehydrogenase (short-subunit alcohol dehydrogenase family)
MTESWLHGRVGIVTGASRGIGCSTAVELAKAGVHVVLASTDEASLTEVETQIRATGGLAKAVPCDVSDEASVDRLFQSAAEIGNLEILVCAAGVLVKGPFDTIPHDDWQTSLGVNLTGTFLCCQRAFRAMKGSGGGRIVTIASLSGVYATEKFPGMVAYIASKHGVVGITESLAVEGKAHGISAVCISPGAVDTQMLREANSQLKPGLGPDDVGRLITGLLGLELLPASGANLPLFSNE